MTQALLQADAATRAGIPVDQATSVMERWNIPSARFADLLGVSDRHWRRLIKQGGTLGLAESDRFMRVSKLLDELGEVFANHKAAEHWLNANVAGLAGRTPLSLLDTDAGIEGVRTILVRISHGVFS
ncbi:MAG: antitoxin Xre/MbcA/ParS toxin-binding domain-containing protein [Pseudomonadota bacterium]